MNTTKKGPSEIQFNFMCKSGRTYQNGESPIVFRVIYRGERKDVFTGICCPANMWMKQERAVNLRYPSGTEINYQLHKILSNAEQTFQKLKFLGDEFTLDDLTDLMKGKTIPPQLIQDYIKIKEKEIAESVAIDIAKTTWYKYRRTINYLNEYLHDKLKNKNIPVSKVDVDFIKGFYQFLRKEKNNQHNSCSALMGCLKSILLPAIKNRTIKENPFEKFIMKREQVEREFLELSEISALEKLEGLSDALTLKRDAFLFACYTGLAYSDIKKISRIYIQEDNDTLIKMNKAL